MKNRIIVELITNEDCNLRCTYCFAKKKNSTEYISLETLKNTFKMIESEVKKNGFNFLDFKVYGGESMLHPNSLIKTIEEYINFVNHTKINSSFILITNGTIYNNDVFRKLSEVENKTNGLAKQNLAFTVDGYKDNHDKFRIFKNGNGSFDLIINNIKRFKTEYPDFRFNIQYVLTEDMFKNIDKLIEFEKQSGLIFNDLVSTDIPYSSLSDEEIEYAIDTIYKNHKHGGGSAYRLGYTSTSTVCNRTNYCGFGYSYISILPNGDIYPCSKAYHNNLDFMKMGNVNEYNGNLKNREFYKNMTVAKKCTKCSEGNGCLGYCYIDNLIYRGDPDKIDNGLCRVNKIYSKVHRKYFPLLKTE